MESLRKTAARIAPDGGTATDETSRPVLARHAEEVRRAEQIVTNTHIQREVRSDFPIVLDKEIELILVIAANSSARIFRLAWRRIRLFVIEELRIGGFARLVFLGNVRHRSGQEQKKVLCQRDIRGK